MNTWKKIQVGFSVAGKFRAWRICYASKGGVIISSFKSGVETANRVAVAGGAFLAINPILYI